MANLDGEKLERLELAVANIEASEFPVTLPCDLRDVATIFNRLFQLNLEFYSALEDCGFAGARETFIDAVREEFARHPVQRMPKGQDRALIAAALREAAFRLPDAGTNDGRAIAAYDATDVFLKTIKNVGDDADDETWKAEFERQYRSKSLSERYDADAVRQSIKLFKPKVRGKWFLAFDRERLELIVIAGDELLHGLPEKSGRPKKR